MDTISANRTGGATAGLPVDDERLPESCGIEIFDGLPDGEFEAIIAEVPTVTASRGTVFYASEGGPAQLYLLRSGRVELYRRAASGKRVTLGIVSEGAFFGEMSLLGDVQAGTGAVAFEASVVHVMSRDYVRSLMLQHPTVAVRGGRRAGQKAPEGAGIATGDALQRRYRPGSGSAIAARSGGRRSCRGVLAPGACRHGGLPSRELDLDPRPFQA